MRRRFPLRAALTAAATALVTAASLGLTAATASASGRPTVMACPAHVYAPYVETYDRRRPRRHGAVLRREVRDARVPADRRGRLLHGVLERSTTTPVAAATFGSEIATIQAHGGNVIPSFGGYSPTPRTPTSPTAAPTSTRSRASTRTSSPPTT